jgi:hypothetical protein
MGGDKNTPYVGCCTPCCSQHTTHKLATLIPTFLVECCEHDGSQHGESSSQRRALAAPKNNPISALALPCLAFGPIRILSPPDGLPKGPPAPLLLLSALRRFSPEFPSLATFSSHGDAEAAPGAPQDPSSRRRAGPLHREGCRCRRRRRQPHRQVDAGTYPPSSPRSPASRFRSALAS